MSVVKHQISHDLLYWMNTACKAHSMFPSRQTKILEKEFVLWLIFDKATVITCITYHLTIINDPSIDEITTPHKKTRDMHTHKSIDVTE